MIFSWVEPSVLQLVVVATIMFVVTVMALFANKNFSYPGIMLFGAVIFLACIATYIYCAAAQLCAVHLIINSGTTRWGWLLAALYSLSVFSGAATIPLRALHKRAQREYW